VLKDGAPYPTDMDEGFRPFGRDVDWLEAREAPIHPLLDKLEFASGGSNWGYQLRFGLFPISDRDLRTIAAAMGWRAACVTQDEAD
jgi:hypothetical protein